jgi:dephospho-CoA kinase
MKRVLLTGMSGTGKSAVVAGLVCRGLKAIDTDYGWCETAPDGEWIWSEALIQELLSAEDADLLFVAGCASNQAKFYDQFDLVILLSAPAELMVERIRNRSSNPFGQSPEELSRILSDLERIEPLLRAGAGAEVRTDRPLDHVLEDVVTLSANA